MRTQIVSLTALCLGACALAPSPHRSELVSQALPKQTAVPPAWVAGAGAVPASQVTGNWLKSLNDPQLETIVAEAIANNLDLRQAAERVQSAQQTVIVVGAQLLPQVGVAAGARSVHDKDRPGDSNTSVAYVSVGWEIDVWGKLRAQRAASEASFEATASEYEFARQSLAATVAKAWYLTKETQQLLTLAEKSVTIYSELLKLIKVRRAAGKDSDLDVVDMQANVDSALASVEAARASYADSRRALELLLGRYPAAEIEVAAAYIPLPPTPASGIPASLLERRPDIIAAEKAVLASFRNLEAANLALLPDLSLSLIGGRLDSPLLGLLRLNPWLTSASIGAFVPIYDGGALRAQIQIATAQQAQLVARYGQTILQAFGEVEKALANEQFLTKRVTFDESALDNRNSAVRIATVQYLAGKKDLLWVSNLQANQIGTETELIKLRSLRRINRISLYLALGGNFDGIPETAIQKAD